MSLMGQCLNDTVLLISESDVIALFIPQKSFLCEMLDLVLTEFFLAIFSMIYGATLLAIHNFYTSIVL